MTQKKMTSKMLSVIASEHSECGNPESGQKAAIIGSPCRPYGLFVMTLILLISLLFSNPAALAGNKSLPVPRFASIKSGEVNARAGPSIKSPIEWVFVRKGEPIEIIAEYEAWRQIRDIKGEGGWVHSSVLSGKRHVIITSKEIITLLKNPDTSSKVIVKVSQNVRCQVSKCKKDWCKVKCQNYEGWILKNYLFGVYESEDF